MKEKQLISYLKNSFFTGTFKTAIVSVSTIILLPLIIRQIGLETYGLISLTMIFGGMAAFVDFGVAKSLTLLIGRDNQKSNVNTNVSSAALINVLILILIAVILITLVYFNVPILGKQLHISDHLKNYIVFVGFLLLVLMLLNNLLTAVLEAYFLMHYINVGFTISAIGLNLFLYVTSLLIDSLYILLMVPVLSFLLVSIFFIVIVRRRTNVRLTKPNKDQVKRILSVSYKFFNIGLINSLMVPANKYVLIYLTGSSTILGIFDIGLKIAMIANNFLNAIAQPLFGVFANMKRNKKRIFKIAINTSLLIFLLYIIGNILFYFTGNYITIFIDINHHEKLFVIGMILLLGVTFSSVSEPFYRALLGTERLNETLYLKLLLPVINIIFYLYLNNYNTLEKITYSYSIAVFLSSFSIIIYYVISHKKIIEK